MNERLDWATAEVVRELRGSLTRTEFAQRCGLDRSHVSMIEAGTRRPKLSVLCQIAKATGLSLTGLVLLIEMKTARGSEPTGRLDALDSNSDKQLHCATSSIGSQGGDPNTQMAGHFAGDRADGLTHRTGLPTPMEIDRGTSTT